MSHRITTQTEIKDRKIAEAALKQAGCTFATEGNGIRITGGGRMGRAFIDLNSGLITGDTDHTSAEALGSLKQFYAEAKVISELQKQGGYVEPGTRQVTKDGEIVFVVQTG